MPTITAIKPQKNNKRVNVYLDYKFAFGIDLENFVKLGLKVEQEINKERVVEIVKKAEFQKILDKILKFATLRPRSEKEINAWLKRKKIHASLYPELFKRLNRLELIDDRLFAKWWVDQRIQFKSKSKRELEFELRNKGISKDIIGETLNEAQIDEGKSARQLLEKNLYKWKKLDRTIAHRKMADFLARKGFAWASIKKALELTFLGEKE